MFSPSNPFCKKKLNPEYTLFPGVSKSFGSKFLVFKVLSATITPFLTYEALTHCSESALPSEPVRTLTFCNVNKLLFRVSEYS